MKTIVKNTIANTVLVLFASLLLACGSCEDNKSDNENGVEVRPTGDVTMLISTGDRAHDLTRKAMDFSQKTNMSPKTVKLDAQQVYQTIDGFGSAVTGSTCYNLLKMSEEARSKFLKETFSHTDGFGHSYIRIAIGCSDFSLSEYTCCDTEGIENFALTAEERDYIIPILLEILTINPEIKIMGSPWTPPRWMKVNNLTDLKPHNEWTSGQLNPAHYQNYATYFVKWIEAMEEQSIQIDAITPQNEPLNRGNSASLFMGWEEQRNFVRDALGPKIKAAGLKTKIYAFDHNYNYDNMDDQQQYPLKIYEDAQAAEFLAGAAYHNYGGNRSELLDIHNSRPDKDLIFTETSIGTWNDGRNLPKRLMEDMREIALGTVANWSTGVVMWNLMLDSNRGPYREGGCKTCYGAVDISADYKNITRNSHYYIMSHMSDVVKPGAVRIGTTGYSLEGMTYLAFKNTDGSWAFVLLNETAEKQKITIEDGVNHFSYEVPAKSVVSYRWKS